MSIRATIADVAHKTGATIDDVATALAPAWGSRRKAARQKVRASFDGASRRRRLELWDGMRRGANTEIDIAAWTLRDRSRDLCANHWAGSRAKTVVKNHVVGSGIVPTPKGDNVEDIAALLEDLMCPTYTGFDVRGGKSLYAIQALAVGTMFEAGDALVVAHFRSPAEMRRMNLAVPLQLRVLEPEHLDETKTGPMKGGHYCIRGIEFDPLDRPVAYWLYRDHPRDMIHRHQLQSHRVPAHLVAHLFDEWRPGQVQGLPWCTPVMVKMRDSADYEDAHLVRQKIAALFSVFVSQQEGLIGGDATDGELLPEKLEPGIVEYLRPGEEVTFAEPPGVDGFSDFSQISARQIAAGCDLTYESLTTDYSNVNFTSARMGWLEMAKSVERWQKSIVIPKLCGKVEMWLRMAIAASTDIDVSGRRWKHTPPRPDMIDPVRETAAMQARVRNGFSSRQQEIAQHGGNAEEVDREIAEDNERAERLGIVLDSNPAQVNGAGMIQPEFSDDTEDDDQQIQSRLRRARELVTAAVHELRGMG